MNLKVALLVLVLAFAAFFAFLVFMPQNTNTDTYNSGTNTDVTLSSPTPTAIITTMPTPTPQTQSKFEIKPNVTYQVVLTTTAGAITVELNTVKTPITAGNFLSLAKADFYNNTKFHRIINGFMIQGGDPKGDGTGGPGYKFADEPFEGEYTAGTIAMANAGPNTNGSQFFIMHKTYPLPKNYVIFGKVVKGMEVVDKIATAPVSANPYSGENSTPVNPIIVTSAQIVETPKN